MSRRRPRPLASRLGKVAAAISATVATLAALVGVLEYADRQIDPEVPVEWMVGTITDLIHAASRQVSSGAMDADAAQRVLLRTARAALRSHLPRAADAP